MKILSKSEKDKKELYELLKKRTPDSFGTQTEAVDAIVQEVRKNGDAALVSYTRQFDSFSLTPENIRVTDEEIE